MKNRRHGSLAMIGTMTGAINSPYRTAKTGRSGGGDAVRFRELGDWG